MSEAEIGHVAEVAGLASDPIYLVIKRLLDITICVAALLFLLPIMVLVALAIGIDSPGPFLYVQTRVGKNGRLFRMYKFRTMVANYDSSEDRKYMADYIAGRVTPKTGVNGETTFKAVRSMHVTRVGRLLRMSSLDELPQIWNILRGDMSLIGPRPNVPWEVEQYTPTQRQRLLVQPGLTGLAQVRGRSKLTFDEIVAYDLEYIRHQSLKLDLLILWWTLIKVLDFRDAG